MKAEEKHAVVLSGGGAYGAFEVGVLKVLLSGTSPSTGYNKLKPDIYSGTSIGAFNAALMTPDEGVDPLARAEFLEEVWMNHMAAAPGKTTNGAYRVRGDVYQYAGEFGSFWPVVREVAGDTLRLSTYFLTRTFSFLASPTSLPERLVQAVDLSAFVSPNPFHELVRAVVDVEAIYRSPTRLRIVAGNWINGDARTFGNEDFGTELGYAPVLASAALPGVFPPYPIGDALYVDGGTVLNTPLDPAIAAGATVLHVIYLNPQIQNIPRRALPDSIDTLLRVYAIMLATKINEDIATARWINEGLQAVQEAGAEAAALAGDPSFVRIGNQFLKRRGSGRMYRPITVHRYYPDRELGDSLGMLDLRQEVIARIIEDGEKRTLTHDCVASGCLLV